jgi:excisionase family DNA binding protein
MENVTFENLPNAVVTLSKQVQELRQIVISQSQKPSGNSLKDFLNIQEAGELLNLAKATIYTKVSKGELPVMKRGKKLYFSKAELISFIEQGRKTTNEEREAEAAQFLAGTKKGLKI